MDSRESDAVAVVECAGCGAVADRPAPPGWVAAEVVPSRPPNRFGACPRCLEARYTFPAPDGPDRPPVPGADRPGEVALTSIHSQ